MVRAVLLLLVGCGRGSGTPTTEVPATAPATTVAAPQAADVVDDGALPAACALGGVTFPLRGGQLTRCEPVVVSLRHETAEDVLGGYVEDLTAAGFTVDRRSGLATARRADTTLRIRVFRSSTKAVQEVNVLLVPAELDAPPQAAEAPGDDAGM